MKKTINIQILFLLGVILISFLFIYGFWVLNSSGYLFFSDGAKFADVARNLLLYGKYGSSFKFFSALNHLNIKTFPFEAEGILPGMPAVIYIFFLIFGVSDVAVSMASISLFLLSLVFLFLLGKKYYGILVGLSSVLIVGTNINFIQYALSGASEILIVLEILLASYLITLKSKFSRLGAIFVIMSMYFTRFNAIAYIVPLIFFWLVLEYGMKKGIWKFVMIFAIGLIIDRVILSWLDGKYFFYQILSGGNHGIIAITPGKSPSNYLRMPISEIVSAKNIAVKIFYNLYNFYKFIPQIFSPYLFTLFLVGVFLPSKNRQIALLKLFSSSLLISAVLVYSLTIPFFRYIHPVIPFLYLIALGTLDNLVETSKRGQLISSVFVIFVLISSLGTILVDSRFLSDTINKGEPPIYVVLSRILKANTTPDSIVVTNLDTWGSWYGERRTVWYPIKPDQLVGFEENVDAIFLTSYLIDDENYYMGSEWRQVFENPMNPKDRFIDENYKFVAEFDVSGYDTYENQAARAVLFLKKGDK